MTNNTDCFRRVYYIRRLLLFNGEIILPTVLFFFIQFDSIYIYIDYYYYHIMLLSLSIVIRYVWTFRVII